MTNRSQVFVFNKNVLIWNRLILSAPGVLKFFSVNLLLWSYLNIIKSDLEEVSESKISYFEKKKKKRKGVDMERLMIRWCPKGLKYFMTVTVIRAVTGAEECFSSMEFNGAPSEEAENRSATDAKTNEAKVSHSWSTAVKKKKLIKSLNQCKNQCRNSNKTI